jgi:T5SS/PEP-CTERM-associated repeat protein
MVVGPLGNGTLRLINGGTVINEAVPGGDVTNCNFGAPIGALPVEGSTPPGELVPGGEGLVTVSGSGSKWLIGGSLQIGGFHDAPGELGDSGDFEGDNVEYVDNAGTGTLFVDTGGLVSRPAPGHRDRTLRNSPFARRLCQRRRRQ